LGTFWPTGTFCFKNGRFWLETFWLWDSGTFVTFWQRDVLTVYHGRPITSCDLQLSPQTNLHIQKHTNLEDSLLPEYESEIKPIFQCCIKFGTVKYFKRKCVGCVNRTRSISTTSTKATSTTRCQSRSELNARSYRLECTSNDPRVSQHRPTSVPYPRHVTSSYGTPFLAPSSIAVTTRQPPSTDSTSSTTVSTDAAGADNFPSVGVAPFVAFPKALEWIGTPVMCWATLTNSPRTETTWKQLFLTSIDTVWWCFRSWGSTIYVKLLVL